jgi:RNA-splicing ligase RtcB
LKKKFEMSTENSTRIHATGEATGFIPAPGDKGKPITVIEAPAAYKDFEAVLDSVKAAGLASEVARLKARFVIKDSDTNGA